MTVVTTDRSGVQDAFTVGPPTPETVASGSATWGYFGYNDGFNRAGVLDPGTLPTMLQNATAGNRDTTTIRFPISWCGNEPSQGVYAWNNPNNGVSKAFEAVRAFNEANPGKKAYIVPTVFDSPNWTRTPGATDSCADTPQPPPQDYAGQGQWSASAYAKWKSFIAALANKYGVNPNYGLVAIEAWNEPNLQAFWPAASRNAAVFADLVASAVEAVKGSANPGILVVPGGLSPVAGGASGEEANKPQNYTKTFLTRLAQLDGWTATDLKAKTGAISLHLYADVDILSSKDDKSMGQIKNQAKKVLDEWKDAGFNIRKPGGASGVPVWITEIGFPARAYKKTSANTRGDAFPNTATPRNQARRLCLAWRQLPGYAKPSMLLVHRLWDEPDTTKEPQGDFGTYGSRGTQSQRPAFNVLKRLAKGYNGSCNALVKEYA